MNTPAHRRTIVHGDNADSTAIERTIGAHLPRSTGYRCSACDAQHGQPHAADCPETSLSRAATIAADMLAELDSTKLPLAVPAAIGVLRTAVDAAASQVHPDSALPSRSNVVADTMDHAQLQALGEHHKAACGQPSGSKHHGAPVSAPSEDRCSCPSGDDDLAWPRPRHGTESAAAAAPADPTK